MRRVIAFLSVLAACNASAESGLADHQVGPAPGSDGPLAMAESSSTSGGPGPAGDSASESPPGDDEDRRFDLREAPDSPTDVGPCDRVDLLFVVDNSGSMADEQQHLIASVPGFIDGVESLLGDQTDYHVGVITTDANEFNGIGCRKLGALTTQTGGELSSNAACGPYSGGFGFMDASDPLDETFACAAQVGIDGDGIEQPMHAISALIDVDQGNVALCNEGFLRADALLVLTIITDEEDDGDSPGDPASWYQTIVDAKGGDASRVVVLSLVGHPKPNECIPSQWTGMMGAEIATRIIEFTGMFEHGQVGDICAQDYGPIFAASVVGIAQACDVVVPVG